jgi:hypothetical protein
MRTIASGIKLVESGGDRVHEVVGDHAGPGDLGGTAMQPDSGAGCFETRKAAGTQCRDHPGEHVAGACRSQP